MTRDPNREARLCDCGDHGFVPLTRGRTALVSPDDVPRLTGVHWHASASRNGTVYAVNSSLGMMHRAILEPEVGVIVDHKDHDGINDQRYNIRVCSPLKNMWNLRCSGAVPLKGVYFNQARGKYRAQIRDASNSRVHLGYYPDPVSAALAYDAAATKHFGEYAATNASLGLLPGA